MTQNKTLVIVLGNSRGSEYAWNSLNERVLKVLNADLAIVTSAGESYNMLYGLAKYVRLTPEYDDWGDCVDDILKQENVVLPDWKEKIVFSKTFDQVSDIGFWGGMKYKDGRMPRGAGIIVACLRYFALDMIKKHDLLTKYDTFIITRSDHYYAFDHPKFEFVDHDNDVNAVNKIWLPEGEDHNGLTDRHCVIHKSHVMTYLNLVPCVVLVSYHEPVMSAMLNVECFIYLLFKFNKMESLVSRFKRVMYTVKTESDSTRWSIGTFRDPAYPGVWIKYPPEYYLTYPDHVMQDNVANYQINIQPMFE